MAKTLIYILGSFAEFATKLFGNEKEFNQLYEGTVAVLIFPVAPDFRKSTVSKVSRLCQLVLLR
jgi:hypothetical protein